MLSAPDKKTAHQWASRQLSHGTARYSLTEANPIGEIDEIEKTGTGIRLLDACDPLPLQTPTWH